MKSNGPWLRTPEAAEYVKLSPSSLEKFRCVGGGPVFHRAGAKICLYHRDALDAWLNEKRMRSTSDPRSQEAV
jgi:hypothetical protein